MNNFDFGDLEGVRRKFGASASKPADLEIQTVIICVIHFETQVDFNIDAKVGTILRIIIYQGLLLHSFIPFAEEPNASFVWL